MKFLLYCSRYLYILTVNSLSGVYDLQMIPPILWVVFPPSYSIPAAHRSGLCLDTVTDSLSPIHWLMACVPHDLWGASDLTAEGHTWAQHEEKMEDMDFRLCICCAPRNKTKTKTKEMESSWKNEFFVILNPMRTWTSSLIKKNIRKTLSSCHFFTCNIVQKIPNIWHHILLGRLKRHNHTHSLLLQDHTTPRGGESGNIL